MKTNLFFVKSFIILFITAFFSISLRAGHTYTADDITVSYDHCAGTVMVKFLIA